MLPFAPVVYGAMALHGIYKVGKAVDTMRYWNDYYNNTGKRARYPFRAGVYDWFNYRW